MEKIYNEVQRKIKSLTVQEPNPYFERKLRLHKKYVDQLDKVVQEYPAYKAEVPNDYDHQLSLLNGITKQIGMLQKEVKEKTSRFERSVDMGDVDIQKYKKVEANLQKFTSRDDLDLTSKRMLEDHIHEYNQQKLMFWIKFGVVLLLIIDLFHEREYKRTGILVGATIVFSLIYMLYARYTSRG
jgi:predicted RND superfamily exporter protein